MNNILEHISPEKNTQALKALIVDDLKINRSLAKVMLERNNFQILEAENGKEALDHFNGNHPDVILMDICMPVMDGVEAMRKIRNLKSGLKDIPIIAFTSGEHEESRKELLKKGFSEYLHKPFKEKDLFEVISLFLPVHKEAS